MSDNLLAWVHALESDEYRQGRGVLAKGNTVDGFEYCCLGVACEVAIANDVAISRKEIEDTEEGEFDEGSVAYEDGKERHLLLPPKVVTDWLGVNDENPELFDVISWEQDNEFVPFPDDMDSPEAREYMVEASELNDASHYTLDQIAQCIRATYGLGDRSV